VKPLLLDLQTVDIGDYMGPRLRGITWQVLRGEAWLVRGEARTGKSTLAQFLIGNLQVINGNYSYDSGTVASVTWESQAEEVFSKWRHDISDFTEGEDQGDTLEEWYKRETEGCRKADEQYRKWGLSELGHRSLSRLSSGETRRAWMARAMAVESDLLILDSPLDGLDLSGQELLTQLLVEWKTPDRTLIVFTRLGTQIIFPWSGVWNLPGQSTKKQLMASPALSCLEPKTVLEIIEGHLEFNGQTIFKNLNWKVKKGEIWHLKGPNGCGKTSLLQLITGELPQAFTNDLKIFGKRRGPDLTLDELRKRIRWITMKMALDYSYDFQGTSGEVILSGWENTHGLRREFVQGEGAARELALAFGVSEAWDKHYYTLSRGQQMAVLCARALVRRPDILILDEPGQALDPYLLGQIHVFCQNFTLEGTAVLMVMHEGSQVPEFVNKTLVWNGKNDILSVEVVR